jgi:hypothetical protein
MDKLKVKEREHITHRNIALDVTRTWHFACVTNRICIVDRW